MSEIEVLLLDVANDSSKSYKDRLLSVLTMILDKCTENRKIFTVTLTYLLQLKKTGKDPAVRVRRRILRLRRLLSAILIEGIKAKEFKQVNIHDANEMLYSVIESAIFRLAVLDQKDIEELKGPYELAVSGILL